MARGAGFVGAMASLVAAVAATGTVPAAAGSQPPAPTARNIRLCHDTATGDACDTATRTRAAGDYQPMTALVTAADGRPVPDVPVVFRETGPATFLPYGGNTILSTTGADGRATVTIDASGSGESVVHAEISPEGTPESFRGPGTDDDECEQSADTAGTREAGNCISPPLRVAWHGGAASTCDDGVDNDADGYADDADPQCTSPSDPSETTTPGGSRVATEREVSIRFGEGKDSLVVFGRVSLVGGGPEQCVDDEEVSVLRRRDGRWVAVGRTITNRDGWYVAVVADVPGTYRTTVHRSEGEEGPDDYGICRKAFRRKAHRHPS